MVPNKYIMREKVFPLSIIFLLDVGTVSTVWYFLDWTIAGKSDFSFPSKIKQKSEQVQKLHKQINRFHITHIYKYIYMTAHFPDLLHILQ